MFAMLEKNPKLTLVCRKGGNEYFMTTETALSTYYKLYAKRDGQITTHPSGHFFGNISLDDDWQIVREPVPWQEALQAWIDGKEIGVAECAGCSAFPNCILQEKFTVNSETNNPHAGFSICRQQFKSAKWYIND